MPTATPGRPFGALLTAILDWSVGARFDVRTGESVFLRSVRPLATYPTAVRDGRVFVQLPVVAANAPRRYVNLVGREGAAALERLSAEARRHLPPLPYAPNKNESHIDTMTMEIHHGRHHAAYVANLNAAVRDHSAIAAMPLDRILMNLSQVPESVRKGKLSLETVG